MTAQLFFIDTVSGEYPVTLAQIRAANPLTVFPEPFNDSFEVFAPVAAVAPPEHNPATHKAVELHPVLSEANWSQAWELIGLSAAEVAAIHAAAWERIKAERDRRAALGVKVGVHWFHSDPKSRTQQLGLVLQGLLGLPIPAGLQWKTLTFTPPPVFVAMTSALAVSVVQATAASDTAIFTAAEVHRMAMEASVAPQDYDFSTGWPVSIEEEANDAGFRFDSSAL